MGIIMDPFTAVTGAAGLVSLAIQVAGGLIKYYDEWSTKDGYLSSTLASLRSLQQNLVIIREATDKLPEDHFHGSAQVQNVIKQCEDGVGNLQALLVKCENAEPPASEKEATEKLKVAMRRLFFPLKKQTLEALNVTVRNLGGDLDLACKALDL